MRTIPTAGPVSVAAFFSQEKPSDVSSPREVQRLHKEKGFVCHDIGVSISKVQELRQVSPPTIPCKILTHLLCRASTELSPPTWLSPYSQVDECTGLSFRLDPVWFTNPECSRSSRFFIPQELLETFTAPPECQALLSLR